MNEGAEAVTTEAAAEVAAEEAQAPKATPKAKTGKKVNGQAAASKGKKNRGSYQPTFAQRLRDAALHGLGVKLSTEEIREVLAAGFMDQAQKDDQAVLAGRGA